VFIPIGDNDPVYRDSALLAEELERRRIPHRLVIYPRGIHAFHAAINMSLAERCWRDHVSYWRECGGEVYEEDPTSHPELPSDHQEL
jgi:acetyl esterase/lipase